MIRQSSVLLLFIVLVICNFSQGQGKFLFKFLLMLKFIWKKFNITKICKNLEKNILNFFEDFFLLKVKANNKEIAKL